MADEYVVWLDRVHCIAESDDDQATSSDEVYFAFALADKSSKKYVVTETQEDVDTGDTFTYIEWILWHGKIDVPLQIHIQGWEEDNGHSPVRDKAGEILGKICEFMQRGLQSGARPKGRQGTVENMWDFVAGVAGATSLILDGMKDDYIGEGTVVFDELPEQGHIEKSVQIGNYYYREHPVTGRKIASVEGAYEVFVCLGKEGELPRRGKIGIGGTEIR
jgi:hypothetical protein